MNGDTAPFLARLRESADVGKDVPLVLLGNFEVEREWGRGEPGLPTFHTPGSDLVVNRMDEFALTLAGPADVVVLKQRPDPGYLAYLSSLGWREPRILTPTVSDPGRDVTGDALAAPELIAELAGLAATGAVLYPHGVSETVEELAKVSGLPLAAPSAAVCKAVNGKVYSRRAGDLLGLRQPPGRACADLVEWADAVEWARTVLASGERVGVKDSYGVSGKGILLIESEGRLDQLDRSFRRRADRTGDDRLGVVVEQWMAKSADLNYQFVVFPDGSVTVDFVKLALTERGVHKGHLMPAPISVEVRSALDRTAAAVGRVMARDGYHGVVGIDAMLDDAGRPYPMIEINARNNMSTYQESLLSQFASPAGVTMARFYPVPADQPVTFDGIRERLGDLLFTGRDGTGLLINNFATAVAGPIAGLPGRLYGLLMGPDEKSVQELDEYVTRRLAVRQHDRSTQ